MSITVVSQRSYNVALDEGQHLRPGESATVSDSARIQSLVADGHLGIVPAASVPASSQRSAPKNSEEE